MSRFNDDWRMMVAVRPWLEARGYRLIKTQGPEGMHQGMHVYEADGLGIRIVADRDQWQVEIHPGPLAEHVVDEDWFDLEPWSRCLGVPVSFHDARRPTTDAEWLEVIASSWQLEPQLDYLREHLDAIEARCEVAALAPTRDCLRAEDRR